MGLIWEFGEYLLFLLLGKDVPGLWEQQDCLANRVGQIRLEMGKRCARTLRSAFARGDLESVKTKGGSHFLSLADFLGAALLRGAFFGITGTRRGFLAGADGAPGRPLRFGAVDWFSLSGASSSAMGAVISLFSGVSARPGLAVWRPVAVLAMASVMDSVVDSRRSLAWSAWSAW